MLCLYFYGRLTVKQNHNFKVKTRSQQLSTHTSCMVHVQMYFLTYHPYMIYFSVILQVGSAPSRFISILIDCIIILYNVMIVELMNLLLQHT